MFALEKEYAFGLLYAMPMSALSMTFICSEKLRKKINISGLIVVFLLVRLLRISIFSADYGVFSIYPVLCSSLACTEKHGKASKHFYRT